MLFAGSDHFVFFFCQIVNKVEEDVVNFNPLFSVTQKVYQLVDRSWFNPDTEQFGN